MSTSEESDYFDGVEAIELRKRRLSRLDTKRVLQSIVRKGKDWDQDWVAGKISYMKTFPVVRYPSWFAKTGDEVFLQVSVRLIPGETAEGAPVEGLKALEVYYRYMNLLAKKPTKTIKEDIEEEEEKDERTEFENDCNVVQTTEWRGTYLSASDMARSYFGLLKSIGQGKIERILERTKRRK